MPNRTLVANHPHEMLTNREKLIIEYLSRGYSAKEIAAHLYNSTETIKKHVQNIYRKLEVGNKIEALRKIGII